MIYLFDKNLDLKQIILKDGVVSAVRTEQTSGASLLSIELREDADVSGILYVGHFDTVNLKRFYVYRILSTTFNKDCWEIEGVDLAYDDLSVSLIKDIRPTDKTPAQILAQILEGTMWGVGDVDPTGTITTNYYYQTMLACVQDLCKLTGAILSPSYGFDGKSITSRQISLLWSVGEDKGKRFVHGSNLISVVQENDNSTIYTALVGRGSGVAIVDDEGEETGGYSRKITFGDVVWSVAAGDPVDKPLGQEYVEIPEYTAAYGLLDGKPRVGIVEFDGEEDPVNLLERTYERLLISGRPQVSYKAVVRDVGDVGLDDTVAIIRPLPSGNDIRYKTKVYKRVVDLLMPQSSVLYFGDVVQNYVSGKLSDLGDKIAEQERSTIGLIDLIKQGKIKAYWGEDGYNYDLLVGNEYGLPAGLYSFDRPIDEDPTKFVYVGAGKVVISDEKDAQDNWVLKTLLDGTGLAVDTVGANQIIAGSITADMITLTDTQSVSDRLSSNASSISTIEAGMASFTTTVGGTTYIDGGMIRTGTLTATGVDVSGKITATSGEISGFTIDDSTMHATNDGSYIRISGASGLHPIIAGTSSSDIRFVVRTNGNLTATNADISGKITATTGKIAGFDISGNNLVGTDVSLKPNEVSIGTANIKSYGAGSIQLGANFVYLGGGTSSATGIFVVSKGTTNERGIALYNGSNNTIALTADSMNPSWNGDSRQGGNIGLPGNRYSYIYLLNQPNISSDARQKENIQDIPIELLEQLSQLKPKMYQQNGKTHFGYVAQDVEHLLYKYDKENLTNYAVLAKSQSYMSLLYGELSVLKDAEVNRRLERLEEKL